MPTANTPHASPILDICPHCRQPIKPGETHGQVAQMNTPPELDRDGGLKAVAGVQCQVVSERPEVKIPV